MREIVLHYKTLPDDLDPAVMEKIDEMDDVKYLIL